MTEQQQAVVAAAIDIGSNTLRAVVARCQTGNIEIVGSDEALVRIGESVNATGAISPEKRDHVVAVLQRFVALAQEHKAEHIFAVATEAIRKATNKDEFLADIEKATGVKIALINGDIEAVLTFYGATFGLTDTVDVADKIGVMDLGGGSMELVLAHDLSITWHTSVPIGSGLVHDRYLRSDPPTMIETVEARTYLQLTLADIRMKTFPPALIATGGSANVLLKLAQQAFGLEQHVQSLTRDILVRCEGLLWSLSAAEMAQRFELDEKRMRILTAGVLIIRAVLEYFRLDSIVVNTYGIREGVLLAYTRYGEQWLESVAEQARASQTDHKDESFGEVGRRMLQERAQAMFAWRDGVLANEDIEAVHKMRVASRRLRALMDIYSTISQPKPFKRVYRNVKDIADMLGLARDTDVMIANLRQQLETCSSEEKAGLRWLVERLTAYRTQHHDTLAPYLRRLDEDTFMQQLLTVLPVDGGADHG